MAEFQAGFRVYADSSSFEKGMAQVTRTAGEVGKKVSSAFDGKAIGRTLATALGISLNDIAEKVARFWLGFSTDAETALEAMVAATGKAADAQERALEKLRAQKKKEKEDARSDREEEEKLWLKFWKDESDRRNKLHKEAMDHTKAEREEHQDFIEEMKIEEKIRIENVRLAEHEAQLARERAEVEKKITDEKIKQLQADAMRNAASDFVMSGTGIFNGKSYGGGARTPEQLQQASDEALRELIAQRRKQIEEINAQKGSGAAGLASAVSGFFVEGAIISQLQTEINRAKYALDQRNEVRGAYSQGGMRSARAAFNGDPLAFDNFFRQYVEDNRDTQKIAADSYELLRQMNERQKSGLPVVNLNL